MKRVPEGKTVPVPGRLEQVRTLMEKLQGHKAFARLRGKMGVYFPKLVDGLFQKSTSPTAFCREWDRVAADVRVVGDLLVKLRRDKLDDAAIELLSALHNPTYTFPGETIPIEETMPVTVLIIDFPRTLAMIKWIRAAHWMDLNAALDGEDCGKLTCDLFKQFPSLPRYSHERRRNGDYEGWDLEAAYTKDALKDESQDVQGSFAMAIRRYPLQIANGTYNDHLEVGQRSGTWIRFGYLLLGEQDQVLRNVPRELQSNISTWFCRVPARILGENPQHLYFGFHPEQRHEEWQHEANAFSSIGCSHGHGMVVLNRDYDAMRDYLKRHNQQMTGAGYCSILSGEGFAFTLQTH